MNRAVKMILLTLACLPAAGHGRSWLEKHWTIYSRFLAPTGESTRTPMDKRGTRLFEADTSSPGWVAATAREHTG